MDDRSTKGYVGPDPDGGDRADSTVRMRMTTTETEDIVQKCVPFGQLDRSGCRRMTRVEQLQTAEEHSLKDMVGNNLHYEEPTMAEATSTTENSVTSASPASASSRGSVYKARRRDVKVMRAPR